MSGNGNFFPVFPGATEESAKNGILRLRKHQFACPGAVPGENRTLLYLPMLYPGLLFAIFAGYLLGSIPFGLLVARSRGIDIRKHGSGNIGATNVLRVVGKKWGILVFALDALKGVAAVLLARHFFGTAGEGVGGGNELPGIVAGLACVVGHNFPVWLRFKGGKGVATTAGVLAGLMPVAALVAFVVWVAVFKISRYVSLASLVAAVAIPATVWYEERQMSVMFCFALIVAAMGIWRHRSNIQRLCAGTENRFEKKK